MKTNREQLNELLRVLEQKYPTKNILAQALGVKYVTVAHWYDGRSLPSFDTTLNMLHLAGWLHE